MNPTTYELLQTELDAARAENVRLVSENEKLQECIGRLRWALGGIQEYTTDPKARSIASEVLKGVQ